MLLTDCDGVTNEIIRMQSSKMCTAHECGNVRGIELVPIKSSYRYKLANFIQSLVV